MEANTGHDFTDPKDRFWALYLKGAEEEDKARVENWKGDTDGILIFVRCFQAHICLDNTMARQTGLFAATVAAFVIESYKQLSADTSAQTVALLAQLVAAQNGTALPPVVPASDTFVPAPSAVVANTLWFLSLVVSLVCALGATLIQQWARNYQRQNQRWRSMQKRGVLHVILCTGVERFGLDNASSWVVALLHLAVSLFMAGLVIFLFPINVIVASFSLGAVAISGIAYVALSVLPVAFLDCPLRTPLTPFVFYARRRLARLVFARALMPIIGFLSHLVASLLRVFERLFCTTALGSKRLVRFRDSVYSSAKSLLSPMDPGFDLSPTASRIQFAVERTLLRADEIVELEAFFQSFIPLLDTLADVCSKSNRQLLDTTTHFCKPVHILRRMDDLLSHGTSSRSALPEPVLIRRYRLVFDSTRRLLETYGQTHCELGPSIFFSEMYNLLLSWHALCLADTYHSRAPQSLARTHLAACRSLFHRIVMEKRIYGNTPWLFMLTYPVLPMHHPNLGCITCEKLRTERAYPSVEGKMYATWAWPLGGPRTNKSTLLCWQWVHLILGNLLTFVNDVLAALPSTVDTYCEVWILLLTDTLNDTQMALSLPI
jgi:hypothetical protein